LAEQEEGRRETQRLKSRELSDITSRAAQGRQLEREQMAQQAGQFGLSLAEQ